MLDDTVRRRAERVFERERREREISDAVTQEKSRHEAAVKNMHRLRALRLARETGCETATLKWFTPL
jgi:hypothetical protein